MVSHNRIQNYITTANQAGLVVIAIEHPGTVKTEKEVIKTMRIGCCAEMQDYLTVKEQGYDYIELSAMELMSHTNQEFQDFLVQYHKTGFPCRGFNALCGANLPIVGPNQDLNALRQYVIRLCRRGEALGIQTIGVGAPEARRPPADWPTEFSDRQMSAFLEMACAVAKQYGILILLEAVNDHDCGYLHKTEDAFRLLRNTNIENSGLVLDYYQARLMSENCKTLEDAMPYVRHVHVSRGERGTFRTFYKTAADEEEIRGIFSHMIRQGYTGDSVSVEADRRFLAEDGRQCRELMKRVWHECAGIGEKKR